MYSQLTTYTLQLKSIYAGIATLLLSTYNLYLNMRVSYNPPRVDERTRVEAGGY